MDGSRISTVGKALSDPGRAEILGIMTSGTAHTAGELARTVGLAPSTTSKHLSLLVDAGLVTVEPSGRHRYFQLAAAEVGDLLEWIDSLDLPETNPPNRPRPGTDLSYARTCYDHLAGQLSVQLLQSLYERQLVSEIDSQPCLTTAGHEWFNGLGIDSHSLSKQRRPLVRTCLDWTQREHHLGGALGAALLDHMFEQRWLRRGRDRRVIKLTRDGARALQEEMGLMS